MLIQVIMLNASVNIFSLFISTYDDEEWSRPHAQRIVMHVARISPRFADMDWICNPAVLQRWTHALKCSRIASLLLRVVNQRVIGAWVYQPRTLGPHCTKVPGCYFDGSALVRRCKGWDMCDILGGLEVDAWMALPEAGICEDPLHC